MTAVSVDEMTVETVERKTGTIMLTTTPAGWEIVGVSKIHRTKDGARQTYRLTVSRCDCRENERSTHRVGVKSYRYHRASNIGTRELCLKQPRHNSNCHTKRDHCASRGHEAKVCALFAAVVKSYR